MGQDIYSTAEYGEWRRMIRACYHPADRRYKSVGAKGIGVHSRWRDRFAHFLRDLGPAPQGARLERKDETKNFTPDNCFWKVSGGK